MFVNYLIIKKNTMKNERPTASNADLNKKDWFSLFLSIIEKGGNALPHSATLFAFFAVFIVVLSWVGYMLGWSAKHPATLEEITSISSL